MFNQIFVSHLTEKGLLSSDQASDALNVARSTKVRIGVLAVESGLMSQDDVEKVNRLQASENARFGDLAISRGYLTAEQFNGLLSKQPKQHVILKQILADKEYLPAEKFEQGLASFKRSLGISDDAFERLQDNDVPMSVEVIAGITPDNPLLSKYAELFIATTLRLIDTDIHLKKAKTCEGCTITHYTEQSCYGDGNHLVAFGTNDKQAAITFAEKYCKFEITDMDEDGQDSLKEFLNCVSGMLVSELSNTGTMELDLKVSEYFENKEIKKGTTVIPFSLPMGDFVITIQ